jgi:hypothetical protein
VSATTGGRLPPADDTDRLNRLLEVLRDSFMHSKEKAGLAVSIWAWSGADALDDDEIETDLDEHGQRLCRLLVEIAPGVPLFYAVPEEERE